MGTTLYWEKVAICLEVAYIQVFFFLLACLFTHKYIHTSIYMHIYTTYFIGLRCFRLDDNVLRLSSTLQRDALGPMRTALQADFDLRNTNNKTTTKKNTSTKPQEKL